MPTRLWTGLVLACAGLLASAIGVAQQRATDGPKYAANRDLIRPADYREWVYLTSGLGMTYGPAGGNGAPARFDNVFVNRESYRNFGHRAKPITYGLNLPARIRRCSAGSS